MTNIPTTDELSQLALRVGQSLHGQQLKLATAESCTGGWVAKLVTEVAGSSAWFDRGFVTYSNEAKQEMLAVPPALIAEYGAVSAEVVAAMTAGALAYSHADWALAISGIAGPEGGTADKPVGTVWFAWQARNQIARTERQLLPGDRDGVRRAACVVALQGLEGRMRG